MSVGDYLRKLPTLDRRPRGGWDASDLKKPDRFETKAARRRLRREHDVARDKFRARIYRLDGGRCRRCSRKVCLKLADARTAFDIGHVHEWVPRSLGGDDLDPLGCLLLCAECHPLIQQGYIAIVAHSLETLLRGLVDFLEHRNAAGVLTPAKLVIVVSGQS